MSVLSSVAAPATARVFSDRSPVVMKYARRMDLLLAEDDNILSDALSAQLRHAGFSVELAENGAVAEYLLLRHNFDVAVLDLGWPLVDGLTVLKPTRAAKPALPVLVLTALDGLEQRVAGL